MFLFLFFLSFSFSCLVPIFNSCESSGEFSRQCRPGRRESGTHLIIGSNWWIYTININKLNTNKTFETFINYCVLYGRITI